MFTKTNEKITFTFDGWDGKSYDGETRTQNVYTSEMHPDKKFVKFYSKKFKTYTYHIVNENKLHSKTLVPVTEFFASED